MQRALHWTFRLLTAISAIAVVISCWFWERSCRTTDYVSRSSLCDLRFRSRPLGEDGYLWSSRGQLSMSRTGRIFREELSTVETPPRLKRVSWRFHRFADHEPTPFVTIPSLPQAWHGFEWSGNRSERWHEISGPEAGSWNANTTTAASPYWAIVVALAILPAIAAYRRLRRKPRTALDQAPSSSSRLGWIGRLAFTLQAAGSALAFVIVLVAWTSTLWTSYRIAGSTHYFTCMHFREGSPARLPFFEAFGWEVKLGSDRIYYERSTPHPLVQIDLINSFAASPSSTDDAPPGDMPLNWETWSPSLVSMSDPKRR